MNDTQKLALGMIIFGSFFAGVQNILTIVASDQIRTEEQCLSDFDLQVDTDLCLQGLEEWNNEILPNMQIRDNIWLGAVVGGIILLIYDKRVPTVKENL